MKRMVIMMGIPGSGKSTFFQQYLRQDFVRVNLDTLKTRHREKLLIEDCIAKGRNYAIDNTNPQKADREKYIPTAKAAGYHIIGYFMESKLSTCMDRNRQRSGKERIPDTAIACISNKLELPSFAEGFDELYFVSNNGKDMTIEKWRE